MRVLGITMMLVALASGLLGMFHSAMPFRVPLTAEDAWHAALVLLVAGALALAAGEK
ncbi:MAG TPA: hypothetical protein VHB74_02320 [Devosia sp.]|nr:hypothetical protein [Devosia sp.]